MKQIDAYFRAAQRGDVAALRDLIETNPLLIHARNAANENGLAVMKRASPSRIDDLLSTLRTEAARIWKQAGLPIDRRDNFTMTEFLVRSEPYSHNAGATTVASAPIGGADLVPTTASLRSQLALRNFESVRAGPDCVTYQFAGSAESNIHEPGVRFVCRVGFEARYGDAGGADREWLDGGAPLRFGASYCRGPYGQIGYAHAILREMIAGAGLIDSGHMLREKHWYWESPESDQNIIEVQIALRE